MHETPTTVAFKDINPAAPLHVLVVPRRHIDDASTVTAEDGPVLADMLLAARAVADAAGLAGPDRGYRLIFNVGPDAMNSVPHLHLHVLGGEPTARGTSASRDRIDDHHPARRVLRPRQPPHGRAARHPRRAPAPDRAGLPRRADRRCRATGSRSRARTPSWWCASSTSSSSWCRPGRHLDSSTMARTIDMVREDIRPSEVLRSEVVRAAGGKTVRPNTAGQKRYVDAISQNIITFGIGPAGTGKSYLAVAQAVHALQSRQVTRIILTRPAVEAGERLGFLPGDLMAKVDPYLRPLYDALYDLLEPEGAQRLLDRGTIEVAPLAFMRGRTLNSSFIILDEAQNTTPEQMKMFLTRIGFGSKCVVTGDVTQIDVPGGRSGLVGLEPVLGGIDDIAFVHLTRRDVVRHKIVADIVDAYEVAEGRAGSTQ